MSRCHLCKGFGLVPISRIIKGCNCDSRRKCYLCENVWKLGFYTECSECLGGVVKIQKKLPIDSSNDNGSSQNPQTIQLLRS